MPGRTSANRLLGVQRTTGPPLPNLAAWYKSDAITGFTDGTSLTSWVDSSGNGNTMAPSGNAPLYYNTTSARLINGKPAVWFASAIGEGMATVTSTVAQPLTLYAVAKFPTGSASGQFITDSVGNGECVLGADTTTWGCYAGSWQNGSAVDNNLDQFSLVLNGVSSLLRVNGVLQASGTAGTDGYTGLYVGKGQFGQYWNGPIVEIMLYSVAHSGAQIAAVEAYLNAKWGT